MKPKISAVPPIRIEFCKRLQEKTIGNVVVLKSHSKAKNLEFLHSLYGKFQEHIESVNDDSMYLWFLAPRHGNRKLVSNMYLIYIVYGFNFWDFP